MRVKDASFDLGQFIELIKVRRSIYALDDKDHHNRLIVDSLWREVAQGMKKPIVECKTKWHQLRNNFARELRRENTYAKRSSWYLKKPLNFLRDHILQSKKRKYVNRNVLKLEQQPKKFIEENETKVETLEISTKQNETFEETITYDDYNGAYPESSQEVENFDHNSMGNHHSTTPSQYNHDSIQHNNQDAAIPMNIGEKEETIKTDERNADLTFFQSLFPDIQKLSSRRKRKFKETVLISLNRFLDEEEEEESNGYRVTYEPVQ